MYYTINYIDGYDHIFKTFHTTAEDEDAALYNLWESGKCGDFDHQIFSIEAAEEAPQPKITKWHVEQQAYIITSSIMDFFDSLDDYGPKYPDPIIIQTAYKTVSDLLNGNIEDVLDSVRDIVEDNEDGDYNNINGAAAEIIEDLTNYKKMYKEVHNEH